MIQHFYTLECDHPTISSNHLSLCILYTNNILYTNILCIMHNILYTNLLCGQFCLFYWPSQFTIGFIYQICQFLFCSLILLFTKYYILVYFFSPLLLKLNSQIPFNFKLSHLLVEVFDTRISCVYLGRYIQSVCIVSNVQISLNSLIQHLFRRVLF